MRFRFSNNYECYYCGSVVWENRRDPVCARCQRSLIVYDTRDPKANDSHGNDRVYGRFLRLGYEGVMAGPTGLGTSTIATAIAMCVASGHRCSASPCGGKGPSPSSPTPTGMTTGIAGSPLPAYTIISTSRRRRHQLTSYIARISG